MTKLSKAKLNCKTKQPSSRVTVRKTLARRRSKMVLADLRRLCTFLETVSNTDLVKPLAKEARYLSSIVGAQILALEQPRIRHNLGRKPFVTYVVTLPDKAPVEVLGMHAVADLIGRKHGTVKVYLCHGGGEFSVPMADANGNPARATVTRQKLSKS